MKVEYRITITKDKEVKVEILSAMDNEMIDGMIGSNSGDEEDDDEDFDWDSSDEEDDEDFDWDSLEETEDDTLDENDTMDEDNTTSFNFGEQKTYTDEERWDYLENNTKDESYKDYKKEKYEKGEFKGYTYTTTLGNIDDLTAEKGETTGLDELNKDSKIFTKDGDVYTLNIKLGDNNQSQINQYASMIKFDVKLVVTLPNKAKSNNATSVDGNTYTWDLTKVKNIELTFDLNGNGLNLPLILGICGGVLVLVVVCVIVLTKKKNKNKNVQIVTENQTTPEVNNE